MAPNILERVANPAYFQSKVSNAAAYYKPLLRSGSVKPLWHLMAFTSVVMYTTNFICLKGGKVKHAREEKKVALDEYYKNHGITSHH
mmetsp:Transcript_22835/g.34838  ORF Transcript_22835/g.34838 Transcript_22835/m.34838 type:complete len:87 (-) Transcript_22835:211-471(-)|eukprot:CAMPEP_0194072454 /NCGR_PEP_ID=MMETSP0149-20130528/206_1 /TAXON_ID=122233 /ORGANISM="Chaetoceros debilis, Strain MM31A-1" /LENGTH=86 /DNA_ID=CAMNT_0038752341 /DNA_START=51 /DNA_END=311 /DNA_ORIENTATION=-